MWNALKTECIHGHPLSGDNLYLRPRGGRGCKTCRTQAAEKYEKNHVHARVPKDGSIVMFGVVR